MEIAMMSGAEENGGCSTPERWECKIPQRSVPPPPPRKKPFSVGRGQGAPPKNGYFKPPDLEEFFFARRQACA